MDFNQLIATVVIGALQSIITTAMPGLPKAPPRPLNIPPGQFQPAPENYYDTNYRPRPGQQGPTISAQSSFSDHARSIAEQAIYRGSAESLYQSARSLRNTYSRDRHPALEHAKKRTIDRVHQLATSLKKEWSLDSTAVEEINNWAAEASSGAPSRPPTDILKGVATRKLEQQKTAYTAHVKELTQQANDLVVIIGEGLEETRAEFKTILDNNNKNHKRTLVGGALAGAAAWKVNNVLKQQKQPQMIWTGNGLLAVEPGRSMREQLDNMHHKSSSIKPLTREALSGMPYSSTPYGDIQRHGANDFRGQQENGNYREGKILNEEYEALIASNKMVLASLQAQQQNLKNALIGIAVVGGATAVGTTAFLLVKSKNDGKKMDDEIANLRRGSEY